MANSKGHVIVHVKKFVNPVCPYLHVSHVVLLMVYHGGMCTKTVNPLCLTLRIFLELCRPAHSDMVHYQTLTRISLVYLVLIILMPSS